MRARFIGDPNDDYSGPDVLIMGGREYPRDQWVEIEDDAVASRIEGNSHFDVDYGKDPFAAFVEYVSPREELATDGSPITDLPKKKGWPKGKPRGPRKVRNENAKE